MLENLRIFTLASGLSRHAARQQAIVANNLANLDTPGFAAKSVPDFSHSLQGANAENNMIRTRVQHFLNDSSSISYRAPIESGSEIKPNGNTVSLEAETLKSIEAERTHSRSIAIYQASLNILRSSIGRGR